MHTYLHKVQYYETDKMGIVHHSNYIRWMEEARIDFLEAIGCGYDRMEERGVFSPVIGVECRYQKPTTFGDQVAVTVTVEEFRGVRLVIGYRMENQATGEPVLTGRSTHCFTDPAGKPILLKKQLPEIDRLLRALAEQKETQG